MGYIAADLMELAEASGTDDPQSELSQEITVYVAEPGDDWPTAARPMCFPLEWAKFHDRYYPWWRYYTLGQPRERKTRRMTDGHEASAEKEVTCSVA